MLVQSSSVSSCEEVEEGARTVSFPSAEATTEQRRASEGGRNGGGCGPATAKDPKVAVAHNQCLQTH